MLIEGRTPVVIKLNGIHEAGTTALREGTVKPFGGYGVELQNRFNASLRYDDRSERAVRSVILDEVQDVAQKLGIQFLVAGNAAPEGYPIHTTILEGLYQEEDFEKRNLLLDTHSKIGLRTLPGLFFNDFRLSGLSWDLQFDAVLVDKGPVLLAATKIPQQIIDIRGELFELYTTFGLKPLPLDNLLHMTLARMTKVVDPSRTDEYIERMKLLHQRVAENPLILQVSVMTRGSAYDMLHGINSPFISHSDSN